MEADSEGNWVMLFVDGSCWKPENQPASVNPYPAPYRAVVRTLANPLAAPEIIESCGHDHRTISAAKRCRQRMSRKHPGFVDVLDARGRPLE